jgi:death-on-curing protein
MTAPEFLDLEEVLETHALQLDEFGGIAGVRDRGLLESAVEQPRATAFGELLHADTGRDGRLFARKRSGVPLPA